MGVDLEQNPDVAEEERVALRLSKDLRARAELLADRDGRSLSNWIKKAMVEKADRDEAAQRSKGEE